MAADCPINVVERLWADCPINVVERLWWHTVPLMLW
jgi:hypothetical protein